MTDLEQRRPGLPTPSGAEGSEPGGRGQVTVRATSRTARPGKRRARVRRRHTVAKVVLSTALVLAMISGLGVVYFYRQFDSNLKVVDISKQMASTVERPEDKFPPGPDGPIDIVIMGEDSRAGDNNIDGDKSTGSRSDTTMLVHLSADRKRAYAVSIPRDSMVDRPDCKRPDGGLAPGEDYVQWNAAFAVGGAACTVSQVEQMTGIHVEHYVVVDFSGFKGMVDAVGGVEVCIPEDWNDEAHGITLKAGTRKISGAEALSYVRIRHVGDGSDITRVKRQQAFVGSMADAVLSAGTLTNPVKVLRFLNAATKSLKLDMNLRQLASLGYEFRGIAGSGIQLITVPLGADPRDPNRVVWTDQADELWKLLSEDKPLTPQLTKDAIKVDNLPGQKPSPGTSAGASPSGAPSSPSTPGSTPDPSDQASPSDAPSPSLGPDGRTEEEEQALKRAGLCA